MTLLQPFVVCALVFFQTTLSMASGTFWDEVKRSQKICSNLECEASPLKKITITTSQWRKIPLETRNHLRNIARSLVDDTWTDTILEGDYVIKGHTRIDDVYFLVKNNDQVGFWIKYSVRAWDTSTCAYDPFDNRDLKPCQEGRIYEAAIVELNLTSFDIDPYFTARFTLNPEP